MKRIIFTLMAAVLLASSCTSVPGLYPKNGKKTVRIVTYNVGVFDKWDGSGIPFTASIVKELDPDVIALQELDSCARRTGEKYQLQDFAAAMGTEWDYAYAPALKPFQGGAYGVGAAWNSERMKAVDKFYINLPKGKGSETRALVVVEFEDMVVAGTHLDYTNDSSQLAQAVLVTETLKARYGESRKPVFVCGDFNAYPDSKTIEYCREHWDILSPEKTTYPDWDTIQEMESEPQTIEATPGLCIDYIMILKNGVDYKLVAADVCVPFESGSVFTSSDHLPVYVDVKF